MSTKTENVTERPNPSEYKDVWKYMYALEDYCNYLEKTNKQ